MLLYKKNGKTLEVYEFSADENELFNYRKEQMKKIPEEKTIYIAEAYPKDKKEKPILERRSNNFNGKVIPIQNLNSHHYAHFFKTNVNLPKDKQENLLNRLYSGEFDKNKIARIKDDNLRYFLLSRAQYEKDTFSSYFNKRILKDIIEVPESLYYLQLLLQEKFSFLEDANISSQLSLFHLEYVDEVSLDELKKIDNLEIAKDSFQKVINKANRDSIIFQKYKKVK